MPSIIAPAHSLTFLLYGFRLQRIKPDRRVQGMDFERIARKLVVSSGIPRPGIYWDWRQGSSSGVTVAFVTSTGKSRLSPKEVKDWFRTALMDAGRKVKQTIAAMNGLGVDFDDDDPGMMLHAQGNVLRVVTEFNLECKDDDEYVVESMETVKDFLEATFHLTYGGEA